MKSFFRYCCCCTNWIRSTNDQHRKYQKNKIKSMIKCVYWNSEEFHNSLDILGSNWFHISNFMRASRSILTNESDVKTIIFVFFFFISSHVRNFILLHTRMPIKIVSRNLNRKSYWTYTNRSIAINILSLYFRKKNQKKKKIIFKTELSHSKTDWNVNKR